MSDENGAPGKNVGTAVVTVEEFSGKTLSLGAQAGSQLASKRGILRGANVNITTAVAVTVDLGNGITFTIPTATPAGTIIPFWDIGFTSLKAAYTNGAGNITFAFKTF